MNVLRQNDAIFGLFEKQLGINCTREQIGLFSNFHEWLPQQLIPNCFEKKRPILFNNSATVNTSFLLVSLLVSPLQVRAEPSFG